MNRDEARVRRVESKLKILKCSVCKRKLNHSIASTGKEWVDEHVFNNRTGKIVCMRCAMKR